MAFGTYRLSFDEQERLRFDAVRVARRRRLAKVRHQARAFELEKLREYKIACIAEEERSRYRNWIALEKETERKLAALLRQRGREIELLGKAQRDARMAVRREENFENEWRRIGNERDERKTERFLSALRFARETNAAKQKRVHCLIENRKEEMERSRIQAAKARRVKRNVEPTKTELKRLSNIGIRKQSYDFLNTRRHRSLGIGEGIEVYAQDTQNANLEAKNENLRRAREDEQMKYHRWRAELRARDRGEVALLRERAIVQKELYLSQIEKLKRLNRKQYQEEITKKASTRDCARKINDSPLAQESILKQASCRDCIRKTNDSPLKDDVEAVFVSDGGKSVCRNTIRRQQERDSKTKTTKRDLNGRSKREECPTKKLEDNAMETRAESLHISSATQTEEALPIPKEKEDISPESLTKERSKKKVSKKQSIRKEKRTQFARNKNTTITKQGEKSQTEKLDVSKHFEAIGGEQNSDRPFSTSDGQNCDRPSSNNQRYEDALSEALSMDTDQFVEQYFNQWDLSSSEYPKEILPTGSCLWKEEPLPSKSQFRTSNILSEPLSIDLSETNDSDSPLPSISFSDSDESERDVSIHKASNTASTTEPSPPLESEDLDPTSFLSCTESFSDVNALIHGIDAISGKSLSLLNSLSRLLSSESGSTEPISESLPSTETTQTQQEQIFDEEHDTSSISSFCFRRSEKEVWDPLLLDPILEGLDPLSSISESEARENSLLEESFKERSI